MFSPCCVIAARFLLSLVAIDGFIATTAQYLQKGHTKEDVDGIFGWISKVLFHAPESIQDPADVGALLQSTLQPIFSKRNEVCKVEYVDRIRPWKELLIQEVSLSGAFRTRKNEAGEVVTGNHSFTFTKAQFLVADLQGDVERRRGMEPAAEDVVALVKRYMGDSELVQPPLMVLPQSMLAMCDGLAQVNDHQGLKVEQDAHDAET